MATENNKEEIKQDSQTEDRSAGDMPKDESAGDMPKDESAGDMQKGASASDMPKGKPAGSMQEKTEPEGAGTDADAAASPDPGTAGVQKREEPAPNAGNSSGYMDPGAKWAAENAKATGADVEKNMKSAGIPGHNGRNCRDTGAEYGSKRRKGRNGKNCKHSRAGADGSFRKYSGC